MALTRDSLLAYLADELDVDTTDIDDDTELFSSSLVDSFSMVDLIGFIEREGGLTMGPFDINLENLDTIGRILAFVRSRSPAYAGSAPR